MKVQRPYAKIIVNKKAEKSLICGHPWVYEGDIIDQDDVRCNGDLVDVLSIKHQYLGTGFYSETSKIRVRIISRNANDVFTEEFFERRLRYALSYRKQVMGDDYSCCRLIFGEADFFPGLTVDRFGDILVTQTLSVGIECRKDMIFRLLYNILTEEGEYIRGIYERNDVSLREKEGLPETTVFFPLSGLEIPTSTITTIIEHGICYEVDFANGQKTGFFLDQKYNRLAVSKLTKGKTVLDCFTHTGSFALNAVLGGAKRVVAVDISETALTTAKKNIILNHAEDKIELVCDDVFHYLDQLEKTSSPFDFIILDPPAFTKSRSTIHRAMAGYKEINRKAMKLLPRGGYLVTCSCSHFASSLLFCQMLKEAAADASVSLRQIEARQQSMDHPILWNVEETEYLKFYIFQVV